MPISKQNRDSPIFPQIIHKFIDIKTASYIYFFKLKLTMCTVSQYLLHSCFNLDLFFYSFGPKRGHKAGKEKHEWWISKLKVKQMMVAVEKTIEDKFIIRNFNAHNMSDQQN